MTPEQMTMRARTAVFAVFAANGAIFASLASRLPDIKAALGLSAGELGTTLLVGMAGSVLGLPASGWVTHRFGARAGVRIGSGILLIGYVVAALAVGVWPSRTLLGAGLFVGSVGMGLWDVSMNLEGASVEKRMGHTVMPVFHACFSGGTVLGAVAGAAAGWARLPVLAHLVVATVLGVALTWWTSAWFLPRRLEADDSTPDESQPEDEGGPGAAPARLGSAWTEPRTLLVGVIVLVAGLTEGTANDWLSLALHEGYALPTWAGVVGFAVFVTAMTTGRIIGSRMLDRYGRVLLLRALFVAAAVGSLLVVLGGPVLAYVGAAVWGLGASLGFPVGLSAAADDPERAPARMSVVSTIGYVAFLAGPPLLGMLGDHVGVLRSLLVVGGFALVALLVVPAAREPRTG